MLTQQQVYAILTSKPEKEFVDCYPIRRPQMSKPCDIAKLIKAGFTSAPEKSYALFIRIIDQNTEFMITVKQRFLDYLQKERENKKKNMTNKEIIEKLSQFCLDSDIHRYFENHDIFKKKTNKQEQQTHGRRQASVNLAICTQEREGQIKKEEQEETFRKEDFTQPKELTRAVNKEYKHTTGIGRQRVEILAKLILLLTEINNKDRNYYIRITAKNILVESSQENIKMFLNQIHSWCSYTLLHTLEDIITSMVNKRENQPTCNNRENNTVMPKHHIVYKTEYSTVYETEDQENHSTTMQYVRGNMDFDIQKLKDTSFLCVTSTNPISIRCKQTLIINTEIKFILHLTVKLQCLQHKDLVMNWVNTQSGLVPLGQLSKPTSDNTQ